jgi:hypothetical protein
VEQVFSRATLTGALLFISFFAGAPATLAGPTAALEIGGQVTQHMIFNVAKLKQLPVATVDVTFFAAGAVTSHSFTGALLWDVLQKAGIVVNASIKNDILRKFVTVIGSDGYEAVFGVGELDPAFGGDQIIIAYAEDGQPLTDEGSPSWWRREIRRAAGSSPTSTRSSCATGRDD